MHKNASPGINIARIEEALILDTTSSRVAFCAKQTFKLHVCMDIHANTLSSNECVFDTGAGLNLMHTNHFLQDG